jgi:hypothetical protein
VATSKLSSGNGSAIHASAHPLYKERYQRTKRRLGRQRGAKVA